MLPRQCDEEYVTVPGAIANYLHLSLTSLNFQTIFVSDLDKALEGTLTEL